MGKYEKPMPRGRHWLRGCILCVLLVSLFISAFCIGNYLAKSRQENNRYDELSSIVESIRQDQPSETTAPAATETTDTTEPRMFPEYAAMYAQNYHLVGWIRIDGTQIDYPVLQSPEERNFYLRRNFDRKNNSHGCIYVNEDCDVNDPSDNVTIYGHFMKDGSMFADLGNYTDREYWEEHRLIQFDTLYQRRTYEIFAVFRTTASIDEGFEYHNFINASSEEDFDWFVKQCKEQAHYDTGITPEYGDKIICLSTCEYSVVNGRLVVAAVLMDD